MENKPETERNYLKEAFEIILGKSLIPYLPQRQHLIALNAFWEARETAPEEERSVEEVGGYDKRGSGGL